MRYKWLILILILIIVETASYAFTGPIKIPENDLTKLNEEIVQYYGYKDDYFTPTSTDGNNRELNMITAQYNNSLHSFYFYGTPFDYETIDGVGMYRNLGYTKTGGVFENPMFPWDYGWSGTRIEDFNLVPEPWKDSRTQTICGNKGHFSGRLVNGEYIIEDRIQAGIDGFYGGKKGSDVLPNGVSVQNRDKTVHDTGASHKSGEPWSKFVHVTQPPTYNHWGTGIAFIINSGGNISYLTIPIAPINLGNNISITEIKNNKETLEKGKTYQCTVTINNSLLEDLNNVDLQLFIDGVEDTTNKQVVTLTKNTPTKATFTYTVPEEYPNKEITLTAKANMIEATRVKEESDYSDNEITLKVPIIDENIDLAVTDIRYEKYPANSRVSAVVEVTNYSTVYCKDIPVFFQVTLNDNTAIKTKIIPGNLLPGATTVLTYDFNTPDANCTLKLYAEVNKDNTFVETNKSNNSKSINAQVIRNTRKLGCYPELEWTEIDKRWEVIGYDAEGNPEYGWVYYTFAYHAYMNSTATVTPQTLKSGYGFEVGVTSTVSYVQVSGEWTRTPDNPPQAPTTARVQVGWDTKYILYAKSRS